MRIVEATLARFAGELREAPVSAKRRWTSRSGLLLQLRDEQGHIGQGEASPLPGYSYDNLEACETALRAIDRDELAGVQHGAPLLEALSAASNRLPAELPAARFALETALLDLAGQQAGKPSWALLRSSVRHLQSQPLPIPLCGLIAARDPDAALGQATRLVGRGLATLKLKVGFDGDIALARAVRDRVGGCVLLRFDANRAWSAERAAGRLRELVEIGPELVEEPTCEPTALADSPVPLALDESLQAPGALDRMRPALRRLRIEAVVLKPAALGGLVQCIELATRAQSLGLGVVVSHLLDGPVALAAAASLALAVASPERASGLDRHPGLSIWPAVHVPLVGATHITPGGDAGLGVETLSGTGAGP